MSPTAGPDGLPPLRDIIERRPRNIVDLLDEMTLRLPGF